MKKSQFELQTALQNDEAFLTFLTQTAQTEKYRQFRENAPKTPHPTDAQLYDYVLGDGAPNALREIRAHLAECGTCAQEALRLAQLETELEQDWLAWGDIPRPPSNGAIPVPPQKRETASALADRLIQWISELWEPQWAGELVTAADVPEQSYTFATADGAINMACSWKGASRYEPAYIQLRWKADLSSASEIRLRWLDPATQALRAEVSLGTRLAGEETFTSADLGFDPSAERWAIAVVLRNVDYH